MEKRPIAIATSLPTLPPSDLALAAALGKRGVDAEPAIWSATDVNWRSFSTVLVRSCWDYHLKPDAFIDWAARLEAEGVIVLNDPALLRWNANKLYLRELQQSGIAIPDTVWLGNGQVADIRLLCEKRHWSRAVTKPLISASAHRTEIASEGVASGDVMVQEYVAAIETAGEWSLMYFGGEFSHAVRKRPRLGDFRVQKEYGGTAELAAPCAELRRFAGSVMARLPIPAVWARIDIVHDDHRALLMELEVIEPELFLEADPAAADRAAAAVLAALEIRVNPSAAR